MDIDPARLLLTGFEPFDGDSINPSWEVARALHGERIAGVRVEAACLPCAFEASLPALREALQRTQPQLVLALGLAAGRSEFSIERVAINLADARIPDNAGARPIDEAVVAGAPAAYFATLPIKAMVAALRAAGLPAAVSQSAGTFVCNQVFFALMHGLQTNPLQAPSARGGFMHLPALPEQAARRPSGMPSLALAQQVEGTRIALAAALAQVGDLRLSGGSES